MKTTDEIILDLGLEYKINPYLLDQVKLAMQIYAQSAIDEIKEKIVGEARMVYHCGHNKTNEQSKHIAIGADNIQIDRESIRSVTIELK